MWVDTPVKTPAWPRRHSRRACFPGQGRGGPPRGALSAHHGGCWGARATRRSSRRNSVHKCPKTAPRGRFRQSVYTPASPRLSITSQQCTQMPQNGSERPFSPICVHSCVPTAACAIGRGYGSHDINDPMAPVMPGPRALGPDGPSVSCQVHAPGRPIASVVISVPVCVVSQVAGVQGARFSWANTPQSCASKLQGTRLGVWSVIQLSNEFAACVAVTHAASRYSWTTTTSPMSVRS